MPSNTTSSFGTLTTHWAAAPALGGMDGLEFSDMSSLVFVEFKQDSDVNSKVFDGGDSDDCSASSDEQDSDLDSEIIDCVDTGINFIGICENDVCRASEREVTCKLDRKGFGSFDLGKDTCNCTCPLCGKVCARIISCCFYACSWKFDGMLAVDAVDSSNSASKYKKQSGEGTAKASDGCFQYKGNLTRWRYLHLMSNACPLRP